MIGPAAHLQGLFLWPGLIDLLGWSWDLAPADIPTIRAMMIGPAAPLWGLFLAHRGQGLLLGRDQDPCSVQERGRAPALERGHGHGPTDGRIAGCALSPNTQKPYRREPPYAPYSGWYMYTHRDNPRGIYVPSCSSRRCRRARTSSLKRARSENEPYKFHQPLLDIPTTVKRQRSSHRPSLPNSSRLLLLLESPPV
jgi:hypothetical protein